MAIYFYNNPYKLVPQRLHSGFYCS